MAGKTVSRAEYDTLLQDLQRLQHYVSDLDYDLRLLRSQVRGLNDEITAEKSKSYYNDRSGTVG